MSQTYLTRRKAEPLPIAQETPRTTVPGPSMQELAAGAAPSQAQMGRRVDLPDAIRAKMETSFGADFSNVKLYESQTVADAGADAMAMGGAIGFAPGKLDLASTAGQAMLGHELSHVVSQARGEVHSRGFLADHALEARANREGALAAAGESVYSGPVAPLSASAVPAATAGAAQALGKSDEKKIAKANKKKAAAEDKAANKQLKSIKERADISNDDWHDMKNSGYTDFLAYTPDIDNPKDPRSLIKLREAQALQYISVMDRQQDASRSPEQKARSLRAMQRSGNDFNSDESARNYLSDRSRVYANGLISMSDDEMNQLMDDLNSEDEKKVLQALGANRKKFMRYKAVKELGMNSTWSDDDRMLFDQRFSMMDEMMNNAEALNRSYTGDDKSVDRGALAGTRRAYRDMRAADAARDQEEAARRAARPPEPEPEPVEFEPEPVEPEPEPQPKMSREEILNKRGEAIRSMGYRNELYETDIYTQLVYDDSFWRNDVEPNNWRIDQHIDDNIDKLNEYVGLKKEADLETLSEESGRMLGEAEQLMLPKDQLVSMNERDTNGMTREKKHRLLKEADFSMNVDDYAKIFHDPQFWAGGELLEDKANDFRARRWDDKEKKVKSKLDDLPMPEETQQRLNALDKSGVFELEGIEGAEDLRWTLVNDERCWGKNGQINEGMARKILIQNYVDKKTREIQHR